MNAMNARNDDALNDVSNHDSNESILAASGDEPVLPIACPDSSQLRAFRDLVAACNAAEGGDRALHEDKMLNFDPGLISWFICTGDGNDASADDRAVIWPDRGGNSGKGNGMISRKDGGRRLLGLASLFAPMRHEAEATFFIHPSADAQQTHAALHGAVTQELGRVGVVDLLHVCTPETPYMRRFAESSGAVFSHAEMTMRLQVPAEPARKALPRIQVRKAEESDLPEMVRISCSAFGDAAQDAENLLRRTLESDDRTQWIGLQERRMVAVGSVFHAPEARMLFGVGVDAVLQNQGIGRAFIEALMAAQEASDKPFELEVDAQNARAVALYRMLGFRPLHENVYMRERIR